ncbi:RING-H2 finger protein ATL39-like [Typha latifolia]|uniref:RING-H2 finger protein ATL39-like n=1 Tax=Typha latifolia TaxID=4733 RepID=UPI003C2FAC82
MPRYSSAGECSWLVFAYYAFLIILGIFAAIVRYMWIAVMVLWLLPFVWICVAMVCCRSTTTRTATRGDEQRINPRIGAAHQPPHAGGPAQSSVAAIPAFVFEKAFDSVDGGGGASPCSVCLESVKGGEMVKKLPVCEHMFHVECIDMWLRTHSTCPNCRATVGPPEEVRTVGVDDPPAESSLPV